MVSCCVKWCNEAGAHMWHNGQDTTCDTCKLYQNAFCTSWETVGDNSSVWVPATHRRELVSYLLTSAGLRGYCGHLGNEPVIGAIYLSPSLSFSLSLSLFLHAPLPPSPAPRSFKKIKIMNF